MTRGLSLGAADAIFGAYGFSGAALAKDCGRKGRRGDCAHRQCASGDLDEEQMAFYLVDMLREAEPELLLERYRLEELEEDPWEVLGQICKRRGISHPGRGV